MGKNGKDAQIGIRFTPALRRRVEEAAIALGITKGDGNPNLSKTAEVLIRRGLLGIGAHRAGLLGPVEMARATAQDHPGRIDEMIAAMVAVAEDVDKKAAIIDGE